MLHGLWSPGSGLVLWHDPAGAAVDTDALPDPLGSIVRAAKFRHKAKVLVAGAYGPEEIQVRVHALAPEAAASVLLQELPAQAVAGDLRYLAHVVRGVERWVRAGRIVPEVRRDDGEWWVRWRLVGGQRQRAWLAELAVAMPAALQVAGRPAELLDNLTAELTDPIARLRIMPKLPALLSTVAQVPIGYSSREGTGVADDGMLDFGAPETGSDRARSRSLPTDTATSDEPQSRSHPLLVALLDAEPLDAGSHRVSAVLEDWRTSLTADEPELVLRLLEPDSEDAAEAGALWRLEVCLRVEGEAPQPVLLPGDPHMVRLAGRSWPPPSWRIRDCGICRVMPAVWICTCPPKWSWTWSRTAPPYCSPPVRDCCCRAPGGLRRRACA